MELQDASATNRIVIEPKDDDFLDLEIVIDNISPGVDVTESGKYMKAGEDKIGTAGSSPCSPNFIHVAVRQTTTESGSADEDYEYIDPSKYLDRLIPFPKWKETCNQHFIKIFGFVIDADILAAAAKGFDKLVERVKEKAQEKFEDIKNTVESKVQSMIGNAQPLSATPLEELEKTPKEYRPPGMVLVDHNNPANQNAWDGFKSGLKDVLSGFKDIAKQLFDFSANRY